MTISKSLFLIISVFVVLNSYHCAAQKDPGSWIIGRQCPITCNDNKKLRLICRRGQQWCVSYNSQSQRGDYCGCCKSDMSPTCSPTPKPTRPVMPSTTMPPVTTFCGEKPFNCKEPVFCDIPGSKPPTGYAPRCICDQDIQGNRVCWQNMYCETLRQMKTCSSSTACPNGYSCVQGAECCGLDKAYCVPPCFNPGAPYIPTNLTQCVPAAASLYC